MKKIYSIYLKNELIHFEDKESFDLFVETYKFKGSGKEQCIYNKEDINFFKPRAGIVLNLKYSLIRIPSFPSYKEQRVFREGRYIVIQTPFCIDELKKNEQLKLGIIKLIKNSYFSKFINIPYYPFRYDIKESLPYYDDLLNKIRTLAMLKNNYEVSK